jgi:hypothetical protein
VLLPSSSLGHTEQEASNKLSDVSSPPYFRVSLVRLGVGVGGGRGEARLQATSTASVLGSRPTCLKWEWYAHFMSCLSLSSAQESPKLLLGNGHIFISFSFNMEFRVTLDQHYSRHPWWLCSVLRPRVKLSNTRSGSTTALGVVRLGWKTRMWTACELREARFSRR